MKSLCAIPMILVCGLCYAQNYRAVQPDTAVYFMNDSGLIRAISIDSSYSDGLDTIYYSFNTVRHDTSHCSGEQFAEYSLNPKGASWLGRQVISKPNGTQVFFNKDQDSIFIKTLALQGESWRLFQLDNGNYLEATVSTVSSENILGTYDSVKTILLEAKDNSNNVIAHPLNGKKIQIAKHRGFTTLLHFYEFPNDTFSYHITDKGILTWREVYDFEVGDKIQIYRSTASYVGDNTYILYHYLDKSFSTDLNTVYYTVEIDSHRYFFNWGRSDSIIRESHNRDTIGISYSNLNGKVIETQPEEFTHGTNDILRWHEYIDYDLYWIDSSCYPRRSAIFKNYEYYPSADSCLLPVIDGIFEEINLIEGIGALSSWSSTGGLLTDHLLFYQKAGCTYGTLFTGISSPELTDNAISIYPNPATNEVTINLNHPISYDATITLHDVTGKEIFAANHAQQFPLHIATDSFNPGFYFMSIRIGSSSVTRKLVIQR